MTSHVEESTLRPKLDTSFYSLEDEELEFFRTLTGITDEEELKVHIVDVQAKAYQVSVWCILVNKHIKTIILDTRI